MLGVLGCFFGVLGIFTIGILFVPLAFLCSLLAVLDGLSKRSGTTIVVGLISLFLAFVAAASSPAFLLAVAGIVGTAVGIAHQ